MSRKDELRRRILKYFLLRGKGTRPELVEYTGSRAATVFEVIDELKTCGFLIEPGRRGKRTGRKAPDLALHGAAGYWLGVDFRREGSAGIIIDGCGNVVCREELSCDRRDLNDCRREIGELIRRLRKSAGKEWELVSGIGFADPGVVDPNNAVSRKAVNIPGWENTATGQWLEGEFHLPVGIWPETMIKTRNEYMLRMPDVPESIFLLTLDEGVGGGFIRNGELFAGSSGCGMEIGHLVIEPAGPMCKCGNRGCVEALVGENGIRQKMEKALQSGMQSSLNMASFDLGAFLDAVPVDKAARIVADQVCENIGQALSAVVTLLNPAMIVFGGRLSKLDKVLLSGVRRVLELNCFADALQELRLELARSDEFDTARGAALRMRDKIWLGE